MRVDWGKYWVSPRRNVKMDHRSAKNAGSDKAKMTSVLALALGYSVRHNTDPPAGFEKTDTLTTVNLVYEIK